MHIEKTWKYSSKEYNKTYTFSYKSFWALFFSSVSPWSSPLSFSPSLLFKSHIVNWVLCFTHSLHYIYIYMSSRRPNKMTFYWDNCYYTLLFRQLVSRSNFPDSAPIDVSHAWQTIFKCILFVFARAWVLYWYKIYNIHIDVWIQRLINTVNISKVVIFIEILIYENFYNDNN